MAVAPVLDEEADDGDTGDGRDDPASQLAHRTPRPAPHELEGGVHGGHGTSARQRPGRPPPHQQSAQGDDEGGHPHIGDDEALEQADDGSQGQPGDEGDDPDGGVPEPEQVGQDLGLEDGDGHPDEAQHRAHGEVDVTGDDDQDHPRGHDRHRGELHRQVPQVARGEEGPAGHEVETDPDHRQQGDHPQHPGVDLAGAHQRPEGGARDGSLVRIQLGDGGLGNAHSLNLGAG